MRVGRVVGNVWATKKNEGLNGHKLLLIRLLETKDREDTGVFVASDKVGAGFGDQVIVSFGSSARLATREEYTPVDAAVVGIVDSIDWIEP